MKTSTGRRRGLARGAVVLLLGVLFLELALSIRRETQTWDEACHIFAGYSYWTRGDFGMNPEHPPLVKLLATAPLLGMRLNVPAHEKLFSKEEDFTSGTAFVYSNDAEAILFRTRMAAALLTLLAALLVFLAAREMFGAAAGLVALLLFVLEPNIVAHGAVVTTDMAMACFLLATVYCFYRYCTQPSPLRLVWTGVAAGLALASKHSGILVFPTLILLAGFELLRPRADTTRMRRAVRFAGAIAAMAAISVALLWASYGFRLHPRPGLDARARVFEYAARLNHPVQVKLIDAFANRHLLPESYLYGLADVGFTADFSHSYLLGKVYPHGQWFYFPIAFLIKTSLALMVLTLLAPVALAVSRARRGREVAFVALPAALYFAAAMASSMNIGVRHILPVYPLLAILAGWVASELIGRWRAAAYVVALLLLFDVISSVRAFPVYVAYANELWGGPANTYRYLSDSNADWGQQLKSVKRYLDHRQVKNCWFAYFADVVADPKYYGIPCKPLTTIASVWLQPSIDVPASVDGPVLISAGTLSGYEFGPGALNPYDQFQRMRPAAVIEHAVFVFDGHYEIPLASALNHVTQSQLQQRAGNLDRALAEAQIATQLAPQALQAQAQLGFVLMKLNRPDEARRALEKALTLAQTVQPELQGGWIPGLHEALTQEKR